MRALGKFVVGAILVLIPSVNGASPKHRAEADALFSTNRVVPIKIEIPPSGIQSLRRDSRKYVPVTLREGEKVYTNLVVHLRGSIGSFRPIGDKSGFTIKVEKGTERFHGLKKFHLNNSVQDHTYLSEWVCTELFRQAGVPAPRVSHAYVELNGRRLGLYQLKESFNDDFLARYFTNTLGNLYGQPSNADVNQPIERVQGEGDNNYADLRALARACMQRDPARSWDDLQKVLDVDRFLSFMAMEVMLCHWDGYTFGTHNFRVYHDLDTGRMVFFPHDTDQMMGDPNQAIMPSPSGLVAQAVMRTAEGRKRYRERFGLLYTNVFKPTLINARIDQAVTNLVPMLRGFDPRLAASFAGNAESLKQRVTGRAAGLERLLNPPKPLRFEGNVAQIRGWKGTKRQGVVALEEANEDGHPVLKIACEKEECSASWRASALLEPGRYRFSGKVRGVGIVARDDGPKTGGFLRVSRGVRSEGLLGNFGWKTVSHEFSIEDSPSEVMLVCELYALKGEIWFDKDSLRLERMP